MATKMKVETNEMTVDSLIHTLLCLKESGAVDGNTQVVLANDDKVLFDKNISIVNTTVNELCDAPCDDTRKVVMIWSSKTF